MERFEVLTQTKDLTIKVVGKNEEELFANAAYGMFSMIMSEIFVFKKNSKNIEHIKIKSSDRGDLLVRFLNELLYHSETHKRAYGAFSFIKLTNDELVALAYHTPLLKPKIVVKAASYHGLKIKKLRDHFEATITFDI